MKLDLRMSIGCVRHGWKLEQVAMRQDSEGLYRCVFVRVKPIICTCGEPLPHSPLCPHCQTMHLDWSAVGTQVVNRLHGDDLKDWR